MNTFGFEASSFLIRDDIKLAYQDYWQRLACAGSWWTGAQRVAIAAEVRQARTCVFCSQRKLALSPNSVAGKHSRNSELDECAVDAVHRIITDQTRITQAWVDGLPQQGISTEAYVELAGIAVTVFSIDEFHRALGLSLETLPEPQAGAPDNYRPAQAIKEVGFVPMIPATDVGDAEADLFPNGRSANVLRAFTLVPNAVRDWMRLSKVQYLSIEGMANLVKQDDRAINRMQMELVAGRVSAINECFY